MHCRGRGSGLLADRCSAGTSAGCLALEAGEKGVGLLDMAQP